MGWALLGGLGECECEGEGEGEGEVNGGGGGGEYDIRRSIAVRRDRKSTRLNSSHSGESRMPSSA